MSRASLAMYDMLAPVQAANDLLWAAVRDRLRVAGLSAPDGLDRTIAYHDIWLQPDLLLAQACGYPFVRQLQGRVRLVATPVYSFAGGKGTERTSFIVVRDTDAGEDLQSFRGRRVAINDLMSNSGMNLLRAALAPLAAGKAFFSAVVVTGGHLRSIRAVQDDMADIAAIDTVSWGLLGRHAPEMLSGLRILAETPSGPGLPLITSLSTPDAALHALRIALEDALADKDLAPATDALGITGLEILDEDDYARLARLGDEAERLGYPILA